MERFLLPQIKGAVIRHNAAKAVTPAFRPPQWVRPKVRLLRRWGPLQSALLLFWSAKVACGPMDCSWCAATDFQHRPRGSHPISLTLLPTNQPSKHQARTCEHLRDETRRRPRGAGPPINLARCHLGECESVRHQLRKVHWQLTSPTAHLTRHKRSLPSESSRKYVA